MGLIKRTQFDIWDEYCVEWTEVIYQWATTLESWIAAEDEVWMMLLISGARDYNEIEIDSVLWIWCWVAQLRMVISCNVVGDKDMLGGWLNWTGGDLDWSYK